MKQIEDFGTFGKRTGLKTLLRLSSPSLTHGEQQRLEQIWFVLTQLCFEALKDYSTEPETALLKMLKTAGEIRKFANLLDNVLNQSARSKRRTALSPMLICPKRLRKVL